MIKMLYIYFLANRGVKIKCIFIPLCFQNPPFVYTLRAL